MFEAIISSSYFPIQAIGILAVVLTRMSYRGWRQGLCQKLCYAAVGMLAVTTIWALISSSHHGMGLGALLSVVSIGATMQVRP